MKKIILIILALVLLLSACSKKNNGDPTTDPGTEPTTEAPTTEAPKDPKVTDYFPLKADVHMKYLGTGNEFAEYETYVDYIDGKIIQFRVENPGTISAVVYSVDDEALKRIYSKGETYYRYDFTDKATNNEILIKAPIKAGTSWTLKEGTTRSITAVDKQISVAAGDYKALEVTTKSADYTTTDYYAKGIGLIKTEYIAPGGDKQFSVVSELEKVEDNTPLTQQVKVYYPEFEKERLVYVNNEITLKTGEEAYKALEQLLRTVPEGAGLKEVLSENARIRSVSVNEDAGLLTIDFSAELVSEMNSGSGTESMLLQCITNTFGEYYQKTRVIITIEGKPYESGHILRKEGEFFTVVTDVIPEYKLK